MLQNLHVKNLALIEEIEVDFSNGLNILTGETGAGKSIILDSINFALGEKVPKDILRDHDETALVELVFYIDNPITLKKLKELEVDVEDEIVILSRKITSGRAVARINGETFSASKLKEIANLLIDIHGQHEHQSLLFKKKHLEILDSYCRYELDPVKIKLSNAYKEYRRLKQEWETANLDITDRARELSLLKYEVDEIEQAQLKLHEDEELEANYRRYINSKKILEAVNSSYDATAQGDNNIASSFGWVIRQLNSVSQYDESIEEITQQAIEIENLLNDFNHALSAYISDSEFDPEEFYFIEKRLDLINHLKSKYGTTIDDILNEHEEKCNRILCLSNYEEYLANLESELKKSTDSVAKLCEQISEIRKKYAQNLANEVKQALCDLNFLDVRFDVQFVQLDNYTANGFDEVEFMIATNPGEEMKQLAKVASGGELSRIMLAIKTIMADGDEIDTLIFDEIDSGISGRTAQMVSEKMNQLSKEHQIICITHLPQIAAMADTHFLIEKKVEDDSTHSSIFKLNREQSVLELARMLGGVEITDAVLQNAKEMKELAYMKK